MTTTLIPPTNEARAAAFWKRQRVDAFKLMAPAALSFVASETNVSVTLWNGDDVKRRFGHNRAVRPAKVVKATSLDDNVQKNHRNGFIKYRSWFRVWARTKAHRDVLADYAMQRLEQAADRDGGMEPLDDGFLDMGPSLDVQLWELEILALAEHNKIPAWDEPALVAFLDKVAHRAVEISQSWRGGRYSPMEVALTQELGQ